MSPYYRYRKLTWDEIGRRSPLNIYIACCSKHEIEITNIWQIINIFVLGGWVDLISKNSRANINLFCFKPLTRKIFQLDLTNKNLHRESHTTVWNRSKPARNQKTTGVHKPTSGEQFPRVYLRFKMQVYGETQNWREISTACCIIWKVHPQEGSFS